MAKKFLIKRFTNQITAANIARAVDYAKQYGFGSATKKLLAKVLYLARTDESADLFNRKDYDIWMRANEPTKNELAKQKDYHFSYRPKISIVVPTFNTPLNFLKPMIDSVKNQTYTEWELCIADGSTNKEVITYLQDQAGLDGRIKVALLDKNYGIAGNTNKAIELATGEFIAFLDHDDTLASFALHEVAKVANDDRQIDLIYSDEDKLSFNGKVRITPHFKPDWSPDNLKSYNYITHLLVAKRSLVKDLGGIRIGYEGSQDYDFVLRATEIATKIAHIPKILYHWREHRDSTSANTESKSYVTFSAQRAITDALTREQKRGRAFKGPFFGSVRVIYGLEKTPLISIIIPTKDNLETLETCIDSILTRSTYPNYEIVITDTGSQNAAVDQYYRSLVNDKRIKILSWDKPFNYSAVNNFSAEHANGDYFIFLNNDIEIQTAEWIESMLEFCQRSDVGAVGAKLFYPDFTVQHGGVILGVGGVAGHSHKSFPHHSDGYFGRLSVPTNLSAVTAACVMIPKKIFNDVGKFDEGYPLAFNDIDLCLRIRERGYLIVWTPYAELIHYESKTRGYEDTPEKQERFRKEIERFKTKWGGLLERGDPYYNRNLTLTREDFSLRKG